MNPGSTPGPTPAHGGAARLRRGAPRAAPSAVARGWAGVKRLWQDVDWSLSYAAFLLYFVVVITHRFSGASFAIAVALGGLIFEKGGRRFPYWLVWLAGFLIWGLIGYTQSAFPDIVWDLGLIEYGKLWLICLVAANVLTNGPRLRFFLVFLLFLYATHPIRGAVFNTFLYGYQMDSRTVWNHAWSNPNDMAALTFLPLGIAAGLLKDRSDWVRKAALGAVIVFPFVILLTRSRGAFLALGLFAALTVLSNLKHVKTLVGLVVVGGAIIAFSPEGTFERFTDLTSAVRGGSVEDANDSNSARQRLEIWGIARDIIVQNPVYGIGLAAYPWAHFYQARGSAETEIGGGGRDTHSTYLRVTAETGYVGLVIFMMPLILGLVRARRARRRFGGVAPDKAAVLGYLEAALLAYMVAAIFGSFAHTVFMWLHVALIGLMTEDLRRAGAFASRAARPPRDLRPSFAHARRPTPRPGLPRPADARG